jgi:hypothetical protein
MERPAESEYASFYAGYVSLVPEIDVIGALESQTTELAEVAAAVPAERETFRYAAGKWTVREVFGHVGDAERVFAYRALCIGRGDTTPLPGFDENEYAANSPAARERLGALVRSFALAREGSLAVLRGLEDAHWRRLGTANGSPVSVRALAFIMVGHVRHHLRVLRERYGVSAERTTT